MNYKKIANEGHEEVSRATTRSVSRHGLSDGMAREKRIRNRAAKRREAKMHIADQLDTVDAARLVDEVEYGDRPMIEYDYPSFHDVNDDITASFDDIGDDYEECGECGYDHAYEQDEAYYSHYDY